MIKIRSEIQEDYEKISKVIFAAFNQEDEVLLVEALRSSPDFIPELSLVAILDDVIVGHILFTKIVIKSEDSECPALSLAPLAVLPEYQNQGIGSKLVHNGLKRCKQLKYGIINVLGHEKYYPRFGFKLASNFGILPHEKEWKNNFFIIELISGALEGIEGTVIYPPEFDLAL